MKRNLIATLFQITLLITTVCSQTENYLSYANVRFGYSFNYPESFTMMEGPINGDGREFISQDRRFYLLSYGTNDNRNDADYEYKDVTTRYNEELLKYDNVTYSKLFRNFYVISGIDKGEIFYLKVYVGNVCTNVIEMKYPISYKADYDDIVTVISNSFQPGNLDEFQ